LVLALSLATLLGSGARLFGAPPEAKPNPGVVIAVDTSRSLEPRDLEAIREKIGAVAAQLDPATPVGVLSFDDDATWLLPAGSPPAEVPAALGKLAPKGRQTVLHDGIVNAARGLAPAGGVVVLATDGRDEGSATTPEDVGRICRDERVRVLTLSIGRQVDRKALRRIALLSGGKELGSLASARPESIATAVREAREAVPAALPAKGGGPAAAPIAAPPAGAPAAVATTPPAEAHPSPSLLSRIPWGLWILLVAAAVLLVFFLIGKGRRGESQELALGLAPAPNAAGDETKRGEAGAIPPTGEATAHHVEAAEELLDPGVFEKTPGAPNIDRTVALDERPMIIVRQPGVPQRAFSLSKDRPLSVGRAAGVNSLQIEDPSLSAQHFRIVSKDGEFFVADLATTNGTFVNNERIRARGLRSGDVVRAGQAEFEFRISLVRPT
jgi:hypothetical protein